MPVTQTLDTNLKVMKTDATAKITAAVIISSAARFWCGRLQVAAWTFARTTRLENNRIRMPRTH